MSAFEQPAPGEYRRVVSTDLFSRTSLAAAQSAFTRHCIVRIQPNGSGMVSVTVKPIADASGAAPEAVMEFWNFVIDAEAQRRLEL